MSLMRRRHLTALGVCIVLNKPRSIVSKRKATRAAFRRALRGDSAWLGSRHQQPMYIRAGLYLTIPSRDVIILFVHTF